MTVGRFRKKPVVIEAMRFEAQERRGGTFGTSESAAALSEWSSGKVRIHDGDPVPEVPSLLTIDTLEGKMSASPGDWIIRGVAGEFYPCKPDIFDKTYEAVND